MGPALLVMAGTRIAGRGVVLKALAYNFDLVALAPEPVKKASFRKMSPLEAQSQFCHPPNVGPASSICFVTCDNAILVRKTVNTIPGILLRKEMVYHNDN